MSVSWKARSTTRFLTSVLFAVSSNAQQPAPVFSLPQGLVASGDASALEDFAKEQESVQSYDLAAQTLEHVAALKPQDSAVQMRLAEDYYRAGPGFNDKALAILPRLSEPDVDVAIRNKANLLHGLILFAEGHSREAQEKFALLLEADAADPRAAIGHASCQIAMGDVLGAADRMDALGQGAQLYAVETRYLFRVALTRLAELRPKISEDSRAALQKIAKLGGIEGP